MANVGATPLPRSVKQAQTRGEIISAARAVFARDGFHGARIDAIAAEAGYTKGAVYSNFAGKADLFLAAMDVNTEIATGTTQSAVTADDPVLRGFALATLEFIAAAGRDDALAERLLERYTPLLRSAVDTARTHRNDDDPLTAEQLGVLIAALDQGIALLSLSRLTSFDDRLMESGIGRILRRHDHPPSEEAGTRGRTPH
jgi:AcrR family transcriptional regulator